MNNEKIKNNVGGKTNRMSLSKEKVMITSWIIFVLLKLDTFQITKLSIAFVVDFLFLKLCIWGILRIGSCDCEGWQI